MGRENLQTEIFNKVSLLSDKIGYEIFNLGISTNPIILISLESSKVLEF